MIANTTFRRKDSATEVFQLLTDFCEFTLLERRQQGWTTTDLSWGKAHEFDYEWVLLTKKYDGTLSFEIMRETYLWDDIENWSVVAFPAVVKGDA